MRVYFDEKMPDILYAKENKSPIKMVWPAQTSHKINSSLFENMSGPPKTSLPCRTLCNMAISILSWMQNTWTWTGAVTDAQHHPRVYAKCSIVKKEFRTCVVLLNSSHSVRHDALWLRACWHIDSTRCTSTHSTFAPLSLIPLEVFLFHSTKYRKNSMDNIETNVGSTLSTTIVQ